MPTQCMTSFTQAVQSGTTMPYGVPTYPEPDSFYYLLASGKSNDRLRA
jgi:hypothetical protein